VPLEFVHFEAAAVSLQSQEVPLHVLFAAQEQVQAVSSQVPPPLVQTALSEILEHWQPVAADQVFSEAQVHRQVELSQVPDVEEHKLASSALQLLLTQQLPSSVYDIEVFLSSPSEQVEGHAVFAIQHMPSS